MIFIMRVTVYIAVRLFGLFALMDHVVEMAMCMVRVIEDGQTSVLPASALLAV